MNYCVYIFLVIHHIFGVICAISYKYFSKFVDSMLHIKDSEKCCFEMQIDC